MRWLSVKRGPYGRALSSQFHRRRSRRRTLALSHFDALRHVRAADRLRHTHQHDLESSGAYDSPADQGGKDAMNRMERK